jgi:hypothetical protein
MAQPPCRVLAGHEFQWEFDFDPKKSGGPWRLRIKKCGYEPPMAVHVSNGGQHAIFIAFDCFVDFVFRSGW